MKKIAIFKTIMGVKLWLFHNIYIFYKKIYKKVPFLKQLWVYRINSKIIVIVVLFIKIFYKQNFKKCNF